MKHAEVHGGEDRPPWAAPLAEHTGGGALERVARDNLLQGGKGVSEGVAILTIGVAKPPPGPDAAQEILVFSGV